MQQKKFSFIAVLLITIGIFNVGDYYFTLKATIIGYQEFNPLISLIIGTVYFPVVKLIIIPLLLFVIWLLRFKVHCIRLHIYVLLLFFSYFTLILYHRINASL